MQHARRKRILADRYANTNIMKGPSLDGISGRAAKFVKRCAQSKDGVVDLFVSCPCPPADTQLTPTQICERTATSALVTPRQLAPPNACSGQIFIRTPSTV